MPKTLAGTLKHTSFFRLTQLSIALALMVGCGSGSSTDPASESSPMQIGVFLDSAVSGIHYETLTQNGTTTADGEFNYLDGETITFSIGGTSLPSALARSVLTPLDLVGTTDFNNTSVVNIARLLQSLDADGDPSNGISIAGSAHLAAEGMSLDFDDTEFDTLAAIFVSNSGGNGILIDAASAIAHLRESLALDTDDDGVVDAEDAFPFDPGESLDTDGDGIGNNADSDDDNDGAPDVADAYPFDPTETLDADGDGIGNNADTDDDNDGVPDTDDSLPYDPNETIDADGDGFGSNTDPDDSDNSVPDLNQAAILSASPAADFTYTVENASQSFSVVGPRSSDTRYVWSSRVGGVHINYSKVEIKTGSEQSFDHYVSSYSYEVYVSGGDFYYVNYEIEYICELQTRVTESSEWVTVDSVIWEVKRGRPEYSDVTYIRNRNDLSELEGRDSLNILVIDNISFEPYDFLSDITEITSSIDIRNNMNLSDLHQLGIERYSPTWIDIDNNDALIDLSGINEDFRGRLSISNNDALVSLTGLEGFTALDVWLDIDNNDSLVSLAALENIESIGSWLTISSNDALTSLDGLNNLQQIGGELTIDNNASLQSLSGLERLSSFGSSTGTIMITNNPSLINLRGLDSVEVLLTHLLVENNESLTSLDGIENLHTLGTNIYGRGLWIKSNPVLMSLSGLSGIQSAVRSIYVTDNPNLTSLVGLDNIPSTLYLGVMSNDRLTSLSGLNGLETVNDGVFIKLNPLLPSLSGLDNLQSVGGHLEVDSNTNLVSVTELGSLSSVGGNISFESNENLCDSNAQVVVEQIENMSGLGGMVAIENKDC